MALGVRSTRCGSRKNWTDFFLFQDGIDIMKYKTFSASIQLLPLSVQKKQQMRGLQYQQGSLVRYHIPLNQHLRHSPNNLQRSQYPFARVTTHFIQLHHSKSFK